MANNAGEVGRYSCAFSDIRTRMRVFDNLPPAVRAALANGVRDWSIEQCHVSLHGGDQARGIKARESAGVVSWIEKNDAKLLKT
jgi:hypothetical protein